MLAEMKHEVYFIHKYMMNDKIHLNMISTKQDYYVVSIN